ncbi:unnamed protein product (macronuclear) [Paramecium tetraurelia]|uniref:Potassium channel domain-containing protein n=1 Tax=Paramecium tetraurelia TaxID=5888 RepID=A0BQC9_PARTE|nr:uncharacterized protein GSPATT00030975001 [Paramecium tetraurelia]CAK60746.1 unnamed protein product [Paramecium tetraurelia]|eukprot:XP_001428144.1 hypothetical protein (macronuclear) [Paramecium tetraurelia strain d4-2]
MNQSNLLYQQHNFSPIQELQAINELEYEQEYLNTGLKGTFNSPNFVIKSQLDTRRTNEVDQTPKQALLPEWTKRAQRTGVSLMAFFFVKRFVQKIRSHRQKLQNINESHLQLIDDQGSDNQVMLTQMKFASPVFQIRNVSRLFRQHTLVKPENPVYVSIKEKYQMMRKYAYERFSKIPQFHPESPKKLMWDYFITLIRLILLVLIPLEITYNPGILFHQILPLTTLLASLLLFDVLIRLNTICYVKGHAVLDRFEIVRQQIFSVLFIDVLTLTPLFYYCIKNGEEISKYYLIILLTSLMQFKYISEVIQKSEESQYFSKSQKGIISLLKLILTLMYILHMFSCIWYFNSNLSIEDSWIQYKFLDQQPWQAQYLEAFYFAIVTMLTIGYGDNVPKSSNEKIVAIFFIMGACLWFSYSVNTIGIIIKEINQNMVERIKKIRVINRYMHKRNIPYGLQYRIREYLNFRWKEEAEIDLQQEEQLLGELSEELKQELRQQSNSVFFSHCSFLSSNFSLEFQNALSCHIARTIIQPQNTFSIFTLGNYKQPHLCFVEQGQLQYLNRHRHSLKGIQCQGQFLQVQDFVTENENTQSYQAIGYVSLLTLSKIDFLAVLNNFPKDYQHYCQLKDSIKLSILKKQLPYGVYCAACKQHDHDLIGCPQLKITIDREVVVKRHLYSKPQERNEWKRSQKRTKDLFQTLTDLDIIEQFTLYFQNEKQKLIKSQLQQQLVFEQESDENPMKSDENISAPPTHDPNQQILMRKQDSILLSQNFSSSNNFPPQPISPIHSMIHSQNHRRKQGIMDSQSSYDNNHSVKRGQNHYDFDLKPPPFNKYTTAKLSMYKKNYLSKYQQQQPQQSQLDIELNQLTDFNEMMQLQIEQLYLKMRKSAINEQLENFNSILDIEMLYLKFKSEQGLDQFEIVKNYDLYMVSHNINKVLQELRNRPIHHFNYMNKLIYYMYFPFEYVMKFLKIQQRERSLKTSRNLGRKPGLSISKIVELKNVFQRKRFTPRRSIKISQVNPDSEA